MDGQRFDDLTRALARGLSRRRVVRGAVGTAVVGLAAHFGLAGAQDPEDVKGGDGGAGGGGGPGATVTASGGNGGAADVRATGGSIAADDSGSGDVDLSVAVGDTNGGAASGGSDGAGSAGDPTTRAGNANAGGDASVEVSGGDISSSAGGSASANANASASADGGDGNSATVNVSNVSGGDGGAGGAGGNASYCGGVLCDGKCCAPGAVCCEGACCTPDRCCPDACCAPGFYCKSGVLCWPDSTALAHPAETVWQAVTDEHALAAWGFANDFKPEVGHRFQLRAAPRAGFDGTVEGEVLAVEAPRRLVFAWRGGPLKTPATVTLSLEPMTGGAGTRLRLTQGDGDAPCKAAALLLGRDWEQRLLREALPRYLSGPRQ